jgi:phosphomevalonate kinase
MQYAKSCDIAMKHFHLTIDSNLDDSNGHKYGLGSSALLHVDLK